MPAVTDPNLLAQLNGGGPAAPSQPRSRAPQVGAPIFTVPEKPGEQVRLQKDIVDLGRSRSASELDDIKAELERLNLGARRKEMEITGGVDTAEAEKTAGFLATRVAGGLAQIAKMRGAGEKPSLGAETVRKIFGDAPANYMTGSDRQRVEAAQLDVLDAALTLGTGAAYTAEQIENYRKSYFPQLGDENATITDKKERLRLLLEAAKVKAGKSAPAIEQALQQAGFTSPQKRRFAEQSFEGAGTEFEAAPRFDQQQQEQINKYLTSPQATAQGYADLVGQFSRANNIEPNQEGNIQEGARIIKALKSGAKLTGGLDYSKVDDAYAKRLGIPERADSGMGAFQRGVGDALSLGFADEISAGISSAILGKPYSESLDFQRGIDRQDREKQGWLRLAGQIGGGFALPMGAARTPGAMAKVGAAYGGAYGAGSAEGDVGDRIRGGVTGAAIGGGLGYGLGKVGSMFGGGRPPPSGPTGADIYTAGRNLGIDVLPADVGGPITRTLTAGFRATPGGALPITNAARRIQDQGMSARARVAAMYGQAQTPVEAGEIATQGALKFRTESRDRVGRLYDQARSEAGNVQIKPEATMQVLDQNIAELSQVPGANTSLSRLQDLRADIAKRGTVSIDGARGMRTQLRQDFIKDGLRGTDIERRVNQAIDASVDDIAASLSKAGKGKAAAMFKEADAKWKDRVETIDKFIMPIIGKQGEKSGEEVFKALQTASQGNSDRLIGFMKALPDDAYGGVSASLIGALGRSAPGRQNAAGNAFSLEAFLTHWNQMSPKAKNFVARGAARRSLDDLATYAEGAKKAGSYTNYSNTGLVLTTGMTGATALSSIPTMGAALAGQASAGLLLSSTKVAGALARLSRAKSPSAQGKAIASLGEVAVKQPALAQDIMGLQQRLYDAFSQSPGRLAAANDENNGRPVPPQEGGM